jgi:signal peptidase I
LAGDQKQERRSNSNEGDRAHQQGTKTHPFWDFWAPVLFTLALYLGIRQLVVEARYIPSGSMLPGLQIQDRLLVEKLTFRTRPPRRGEIVVFNSPYAFDPALRSPQRPSPLRCILVNLPLVSFIPGLANPACDAYIKRVIAVAGDRVVVSPSGEVILNGEPLEEPYVQRFCAVNEQGMSPCRTIDTTVPDASVLVLGDNRQNSWDGRFWPGGPFLPENEILGRAVIRFWPLNRLGGLSD